MSEPEASFTVLVELGHDNDLIALVRDEHKVGPDMTRLSWWAGEWRKVADDVTLEPPVELPGGEVDVPVLWSGTEPFLEERVTVVEAIERYGKLVTARWRDTLRELRERSERVDDPDEVLRNIEIHGKTDPLEFRDPDSVTDDEGREQAAHEVLENSIEALFTLPEYGTLLGPAARFYEEINAAAAEHPRVVVDLLYEAGRASHGWAA